MIAIIVAYAKNRVIGKNGKIPWNIKADKERFKKLTMGNILIMGRNTFEEIGKPLPGRETIVISKTKEYTYDNCRTVETLANAIKLARIMGEVDKKKIFLAGGQRVYEEGLNYADELYVTELSEEFEGNSYFPEVDFSQWELVLEEEKKENDFSWKNSVYKRKY